MADNEDLKVDMDKPLTVTIRPDAVVASWWVHLMVGEDAVRTWSGKTSDEAADVAIIPAADLKPGRNVLWQLVVFGATSADIDYQIVVVFEQGAELDRDPATGPVKKKKTKSHSKTRELEAAQ